MSKRKPKRKTTKKVEFLKVPKVFFKIRTKNDGQLRKNDETKPLQTLII
jgi:hypothetical protein